MGKVFVQDFYVEKKVEITKEMIDAFKIQYFNSETIDSHKREIIKEKVKNLFELGDFEVETYLVLDSEKQIFFIGKENNLYGNIFLDNVVIVKIDFLNKNDEQIIRKISQKIKREQNKLNNQTLQFEKLVKATKKIL